MRACAQMIALAAMLAAPLYGVRITGELTARFPDNSQATFALNGPNFSLDIGWPRMFSLIGPFESACHFEGCGPGDLIGVDLGVQSALGGASGTIDGTLYPSLSLSDPFGMLNPFTEFFGGGPTITVTDSPSYTVPFELTGRIAAYDDSGVCVLCRPSKVTDDGLDSIPIFGRGHATVKLMENLDPPDPQVPLKPFRVESVTYRFEVPEPATFAITGTALAAGLLLASRRRTQAAGPCVSSTRVFAASRRNTA